MTTVTIPNTATRNEIRCDCIHLYNDMSIKLPEDRLPTDEELIRKYGTIILDIMLEPQDAMGVQVGERIRTTSRRPVLANILDKVYTRPDGTIFLGRQLLWDLCIMTDEHKS